MRGPQAGRPANGEDTEADVLHLRQSLAHFSARKTLLTGRRYTQAPQSRLRRIVSNIELLGEHSGYIRVGTNCLVFESNLRDDTIWAARNEYRLREEGRDFRMAYKKIILVNNHKPIFTLHFLI